MFGCIVCNEYASLFVLMFIKSINKQDVVVRYPLNLQKVFYIQYVDFDSMVSVGWFWGDAIKQYWALNWRVELLGCFILRFNET